MTPVSSSLMSEKDGYVFPEESAGMSLNLSLFIALNRSKNVHINRPNLSKMALHRTVLAILLFWNEEEY